MLNGSQDVGSKGAGGKESSDFTVDSEVRAAHGSEAALDGLSQISGALGGRSDVASERKRICTGSSGARTSEEYVYWSRWMTAKAICCSATWVTLVHQGWHLEGAGDDK